MSFSVSSSDMLLLTLFQLYPSILCLLSALPPSCPIPQHPDSFLLCLLPALSLSTLTSFLLCLLPAPTLEVPSLLYVKCTMLPTLSPSNPVFRPHLSLPLRISFLLSFIYVYPHYEHLYTHMKI